MEKNIKLAIIGGGPAGLAAALGAFEKGLSPSEILIIERDAVLGGILNQCIHSGFGLHRFGEELTGPEYAERYINEIKKNGIGYVTNAMVLSLDENKTVTYISPEEGIVCVHSQAVILAMGCRERTRGALNIPGFRPSGVFTAGTAQRFVNIEGFMPGKRVVILGSGDIGLIMARRMTLEGARVLAVCELMPHSSGLSRNIAQCLDDFEIPLLLSHTVTGIEGKDRLCAITIARVDDKLLPIPETEQRIECDTLLLSVGLIPENEVSKGAGIELDKITSGAVVDNFRKTGVDGIFACGNVLHVHDLVDFVSAESRLAGESAAMYTLGLMPDGKKASVVAADGVRYVVPQKIVKGTVTEQTEFFYRVGKSYRNVYLEVTCDGKSIAKRKLLRAAPGEMEHISFKGEALTAINECENLSFAIKEGEQ